MARTRDPRVDAYIDALPGWQQVACREVRDLVHAADPEVVETIKFTNRPYFVLQGNICALLAAKDHVNVFLYRSLGCSGTNRLTNPEHVPLAISKPCAALRVALARVVAGDIRDPVDCPQAGEVVFLEDHPACA